jgi:hypothetical protein
MDLMLPSLPLAKRFFERISEGSLGESPPNASRRGDRPRGGVSQMQSG